MLNTTFNVFRKKSFRRAWKTPQICTVVICYSFCAQKIDMTSHLARQTPPFPHHTVTLYHIPSHYVDLFLPPLERCELYGRPLSGKILASVKGWLLHLPTKRHHAHLISRAQSFVISVLGVKLRGRQNEFDWGRNGGVSTPNCSLV